MNATQFKMIPPTWLHIEEGRKWPKRLKVPFFSSWTPKKWEKSIRHSSGFASQDRVCVLKHTLEITPTLRHEGNAFPHCSPSQAGCNTPGLLFIPPSGSKNLPVAVLCCVVSLQKHAEAPTEHRFEQEGAVFLEICSIFFKWLRMRLLQSADGWNMQPLIVVNGPWNVQLHSWRWFEAVKLRDVQFEASPPDILLFMYAAWLKPTLTCVFTWPG